MNCRNIISIQITLQQRIIYGTAQVISTRPDRYCVCSCYCTGHFKCNTWPPLCDFALPFFGWGSSSWAVHDIPCVTTIPADVHQTSFALTHNQSDLRLPNQVRLGFDTNKTKTNAILRLLLFRCPDQQVSTSPLAPTITNTTLGRTFKAISSPKRINCMHIILR